LYFKLFINNEFVNAKSGKTFETVNPANGKVIANVAEADAVSDLLLIFIRTIINLKLNNMI
jgi:acyl-CoA reductase-like NAD-dependent aldehyde dehydrogenase